MQKYSLKHVADGTLRQNAKALAARDRTNTAELLAHIAEVDVRELHLEWGFSCLHAYCERELHLKEQAAHKRINAARAALKFPVLFEAVADGRLNLSDVVLLGPRLTAENVGELMAEAAGKPRAEIERLLADRFPRLDVPARIAEITTSSEPTSLSPGKVSAELELSPGKAGTGDSSRIQPLGQKRFAVETTVSEKAHDDLKYAAALLGLRVGPENLRELTERAYAALAREAEKNKFGSRSGSRRAAHHSTNPRHVPKEILRRVMERDGGRCTYVSPDGRRCEATSRLELDHIVPVAKGGQATVENLRARCRGHNQLEAKRTFGAEFMKSKVEGARAERAAATTATSKPFDGDVVRCLRRLGMHVDEAQEAAANSGASPDEKIEERVRAALQWLGRVRRRLQSAPPTHRPEVGMSSACGA
jgi:5-methylcytosine-specific restriction endonuclease McrA